MVQLTCEDSTASGKADEDGGLDRVDDVEQAHALHRCVVLGEGALKHVDHIIVRVAFGNTGSSFNGFESHRCQVNSSILNPLPMAISTCYNLWGKVGK